MASVANSDWFDARRFCPCCVCRLYICIDMLPTATGLIPGGSAPVVYAAFISKTLLPTATGLIPGGSAPVVYVASAASHLFAALMRPVIILLCGASLSLGSQCCQPFVCCVDASSHHTPMWSQLVLYPPATWRLEDGQCRHLHQGALLCIWSPPTMCLF
jgi:hypothetical protein